MNTTEDDILAKYADDMDLSDAEGAETGTESGTEGTEGSDVGTSEEGQQQRQQQQQQTTEQASGRDQQARQTQQTNQQQGRDGPSSKNVREAGLKADDKGNIVNDKGEVVATAGNQRRQFEAALEQVRSFANERPQLLQQVSTLTDRIAELEATNNVPPRLGLNSQEAVQGMQLMAAYKRDPVGTINHILTEAQAAGHDISGVGPGKGTDVISLFSRMLDERLAPLTQQQQQTQQSSADEAAATAQYNAFIARHAHAETHQNVIATMMEREPTLSAEAAYHQLHAYCLQSGLDFTQPLAPQIEARQSGQQPGTTEQQNGPGLPTGGSRGQNAATEDADVDIASADASYTDIVRASMKEAGL